MAAPMEFKVKKGKELSIDSRLTEFEKEITTSRFPWFYEWLRSMNSSFFTAHHPNDPIPAKLKIKTLGDLTLLRARELREEFCNAQIELFYLFEKPPITPKKLDDTVSMVFHNRDNFAKLPQEEFTLWEKICKMAVDSENLLRNALNPELEIQDYALKYGLMNSSLALYLWTRRELREGNLEEVRKQHEGSVEKKLELLKRYSPFAGVACMMSEAFAGEPMPPPFKKIIPEAPKDAASSEKEEIEKEKVKVLAEKAAVEAKVKSLTEQRLPIDSLFSDALLLRLLTGSELGNATLDFQPDPASKVGIRDPGNFLAVMMIANGAERLDAGSLRSNEVVAQINEAVRFLTEKIEASRKLLPTTEITTFANQMVEKIMLECKMELANFAPGATVETLLT